MHSRLLRAASAVTEITYRVQTSAKSDMGKVTKLIKQISGSGSGPSTVYNLLFSKRSRMFREISSRTDRQIDTQTYSSQYFATAPAGQVILPAKAREYVLPALVCVCVCLSVCVSEHDN